MTDDEFQKGAIAFTEPLLKLSVEELATLSRFFGYVRTYPDDGADTVKRDYALFMHHHLGELRTARKRLLEVEGALRVLGIR